jgi:hypothetical protein
MARDTAPVSTRSWDLLLVAVPRHGYRGRPMRGCALMDTLGTEVVRRRGLLSGCHGEDVLGKFSK